MVGYYRLPNGKIFAPGGRPGIVTYEKFLECCCGEASSPSPSPSPSWPSASGSFPTPSSSPVDYVDADCCACSRVPRVATGVVVGIDTITGGGTNCECEICAELNGTYPMQHDSGCSWIGPWGSLPNCLCGKYWGFITTGPGPDDGYWGWITNHPAAYPYDCIYRASFSIGYPDCEYVAPSVFTLQRSGVGTTVWFQVRMHATIAPYCDGDGILRGTFETLDWHTMSPYPESTQFGFKCNNEDRVGPYPNTGCFLFSGDPPSVTVTL